MREVKAYRAEDGRLFEKAEEATRYEIEQRFISMFANPTLNNAEALTRHLLMNAEAITNDLRIFLNARAAP